MEVKPIAHINSPSRNNYYKLREGKGFSLSEIKKAGKSIQLLKELGIKIDYFRKSTHDFNVKVLKTLKSIEKKGEKRQPFVKKEKKRTAFKPLPPKKKMKKPAAKTVTKKKSAPKPKKIKEKVPKVKVETIKEKTPTQEIKKEKIKVKTPTQEIKKEKIEIKTSKKEGTSLTSLTGLGITTAKKFESIGVTSVEELIKENPEELAKLVKGASVVRISTWIKEGQKLLEESK
ncbi:MAG: helix-hairpin-helix domain-containing protein [Promethearchaeota archaeon]